MGMQFPFMVQFFSVLMIENVEVRDTCEWKLRTLFVRRIIHAIF